MPLAALTANNVPIQLRALLRSRGADASNLRNNSILALVDPALEAMAYRIARGPDYHGLQTQFTGLLPVAGLLDRGELLPGAIFDIARSTLKDGAGTLLIPVDSLTLLHYGDLPTGQVYYAQEGEHLRIRASDGTTNTYATALTLTANYVPTLAQVPVEYHGLFLDTLAELVTEQRPAMRAQEMSEVGRA